MTTTSRDEFTLLRELRDRPRIFLRLREVQGSELQRQQILREEFPDDLVRAALTLEQLRERAAAKFLRAGEMWLDRQGLEQATAEEVARHKAARFSGCSERVFDYCCGIGGDAIALAAAGPVLAVDRNPAACLRTAWNAEVYGVAENVQCLCADVERLPPPPGLLHVDPDRRAGGRGRSLRVEDSVPGLESLRRWVDACPGGAIKLSPASNFGGKFANVEIELISLHGECKEAAIWFGKLATPGLYRATVLPAGETLAADPLSAYPEQGPLAAYLYDPDPAIVRSGLVDVLSERLGLRRLDAAEEYLTADKLVTSPFVVPFEVLAELPNNDREIRRYFRAAEVGQVEIKCRHLPIQAEQVRRKLPLQGSGSLSLIFCRIDGRARAVVARRVPN